MKKKVKKKRKEKKKGELIIETTVLTVYLFILCTPSRHLQYIRPMTSSFTSSHPPFLSLSLIVFLSQEYIQCKKQCHSSSGLYLHGYSPPWLAIQSPACDICHEVSLRKTLILTPSYANICKMEKKKKTQNTAALKLKRGKAAACL